MFCLNRMMSVTPTLTNITNVNTLQSNQFWHWLTIIFNSKLSGIDKTFTRRVSQSRIDEIGPDRACAEWLMRNGATVRWKGYNGFVTSYDNLPKDDESAVRPYYLQEVDASNSSIAHHGFAHFKNCKYIECIKFENCLYLEDAALKELKVIKSSLESLLILKCPNISDDGLLSLSSLLKLKTLELAELENVKDLQQCARKLQASLPNCNITTADKVKS